MPARSKGRSSFDHRGRAFMWHVRDENTLVVVSEDKRFIVHYPLLWDSSSSPEIHVVGADFPRAPGVKRPTNIVAPALYGTSMGGTVGNLLNWCFPRSEGSEF